MNPIDAAIIGILALSVIFGCVRGVLRSLFGIAAIIAAFINAKEYGPSFYPTAAAWFGESPFTLGAAYTGVFVGVFVPLTVLALMLRAIFIRLDMGAFDIAGGCIFGAVRGLFFGVLLVMVLSLLPIQKTKAWNESGMVPVIAAIMKVSMQHKALRPYRRYWRFTREGYPRFNMDILLAGINAENNIKVEVGANSRKETLDEIKDELLNENMPPNEEVQKQAKAFSDKIREEEDGADLYKQVMIMAGKMLGVCKEHETTSCVDKMTGKNRRSGTL